MKRRRFLGGALAAGVATGAGQGSAPAGGSAAIAMTWFHTRRDLDVERLRRFVGESLLPAHHRAGRKPVGVFQPMIGPDNPSLLVVVPYPSIAAVEETRVKLDADAEWSEKAKAFDATWDLAYERMEASLLTGFRTFSGIELPKGDASRPNVFELRVYESRNTSAHLRKVAMFDGGEIDIFRRVGIQPLFFGSTVFGPRMPSLAYMVYYPTWEARAAAWSKFVQDPEWKKLSGAAGSSDRELVSAISNQLMSPAPFSDIR